MPLNRLATNPGEKCGPGLDGDTRVLVIAPHPDDETLATGGLLQRAHAAGAAVSIAMLTRGDNNPWPQRWLERRWRIGPAERRRWGERRMREATQALQQLGLGGEVLTQFGWPDMGLTEMLLGDGQRMHRQLREHVDAFEPSLVVLPALADTHPDHGAAHVLTMSVLHELAAPVRCLDYLVHGRARGGGVACSVRLSPRQRARKRAALLCHASQVALGRRRLLRQVTDQEVFRPLDRQGPSARGAPVPARVLARACELLVHAGKRTWVAPWRGDANLAALVAAAPGPAWCKPRLRWRTPWIFDHWGWRRIERDGSPLDHDHAPG